MDRGVPGLVLVAEAERPAGGIPGVDPWPGGRALDRHPAWFQAPIMEIPDASRSCSPPARLQHEARQWHLHPDHPRRLPEDSMTRT